MRLNTPTLSHPPATIGSIEFAKGYSRLFVYLDEQHRWHCDDPEIERVLEEACPADPDHDTSKWSARYLLYTAAQRLGGQVSFPK
ncbi:MAG: hypothetical protein RLN76_02605 [Phycisphaeraceae bacterium]